MFGFRRKRQLEIPEDWQFYTRERNGRPESWTTNLALRAVAPIAGCTQLICVSAPLQHPKSDGQLSPEEAVEVDGWRLPVTDRELLTPLRAVPAAIQTAEEI